ncbi:MAG: hypothetical protein A2408_01050 [Candidatus Yonathbacteria bacterium RIFOXYC1_FULL_52_10]|uniref:Pirin n=1 Tax=Candidatus Yonathbacteria bacterium RIFOXYD1_FULL_52_36 TaxID=1802730 RepID=A0A1G2SNV1_9BACT|nr:MAG: hypothetical protein A2408_01050 [Candidatus Yonathbacteria bacterium RIFOXYC1_FULL_52_10]OHA86378.1 MAG: hypothetical protein A2591_02675 [Candidatus Yonathbacteria bacterium RIFOXYD1_FULL_52_36]
MTSQNIRTIDQVFTVAEAFEGAGVRLHRGFGPAEVPRFDPFLLFDDFSSPNPADYLPGFPWHPHRGIETVTYVLDGSVCHRDSLGNEGVITGGDIQWMTAGSGIIHEEMPEGTGALRGFQLWVNLPKAHKMTTPRYQDLVGRTVPEVAVGKYAHAKVIAGTIDGAKGLIEDIAAQPLYVDISLEAERSLTVPVANRDTVFLYVLDGALGAGSDEVVRYAKGAIVLFARDGNAVSVRAGGNGARFLLVSGTPLGETVAWRGPIVMNTDDELRTAFTELHEGTFIKDV